MMTLNAVSARRMSFGSPVVCRGWTAGAAIGKPMSPGLLCDAGRASIVEA
jgi:hypothetical protein